MPGLGSPRVTDSDGSQQDAAGGATTATGTAAQAVPQQASGSALPAAEGAAASDLGMEDRSGSAPASPASPEAPAEAGGEPRGEAAGGEAASGVGAGGKAPSGEAASGEASRGAPAPAGGDGSEASAASEGERGEQDTTDADDTESSESDEDYAAVLDRMKALMVEGGPSQPPKEREPLLSTFDLAGLADLIKSGKAKRIVCMVGAGISVAAGIPDFRSPETGLYSQLAKYDLPHPHAVFEISFFKENPAPFYLLAKELFPGSFRPTATHFFMRMLHEKGLLARCFTQNIDSLESLAGLPTDAVVAAHGNFDSAHCIACKEEHSTAFVRDAVMRGDGSPCVCTVCGGLVKPDIVFFGESLPERFWEAALTDMPECDALLVMGTSLVVQPFASLIDKVSEDCPRALINRERVGEVDEMLRALGYTKGFNFGTGNYRDALYLGDCDAGVWELCRLLGWEQDLTDMIDDARTPL